MLHFPSVYFFVVELITGTHVSQISGFSTSQSTGLTILAHDMLSTMGNTKIDRSAKSPYTFLKKWKFWKFCWHSQRHLCSQRSCALHKHHTRFIDGPSDRYCFNLQSYLNRFQNLSTIFSKMASELCKFSVFHPSLRVASRKTETDNWKSRDKSLVDQLY